MMKANNVEIIKEAYFHELQILADRFNIAKHTLWETDDYDDAQWVEGVLDDIKSLKTLMENIHCKGSYFCNEDGYITMIQMGTDDLEEVWRYELNVEKFSE